LISEEHSLQIGQLAKSTKNLFKMVCLQARIEPRLSGIQSRSGYHIGVRCFWRGGGVFS
jgi:hypothetical protein